MFVKLQLTQKRLHPNQMFLKNGNTKLGACVRVMFTASFVRCLFAKKVKK